MKIRKIIFGAAVVIVGLPLAVALIATVSISVFDRTNGTTGESSGRIRQLQSHFLTPTKSVRGSVPICR